jgi:hypothetical protein
MPANATNSGHAIYPADIDAFLEQLGHIGEDFREFASGLTEAQGAWREAPEKWSVAQCLDHLAVSNRIYLGPMGQAADKARVRGRMRKGPMKAGRIGGWFANMFEPDGPNGPQGPKPKKFKAPKAIQPQEAPPLKEALDAFVASQAEVARFLQTNADIDLSGVMFANPMIPGLRFSLASGLRIIAAHERRHLQQARQILQWKDLK